jgi:hypothetical protein
MAFAMAVTRKGFSASYWKILKVRCNVANDNPSSGTINVKVAIGLYKDRATRLADITDNILLRRETVSLDLSDIRITNIYTELKTTDFFNSASDVLE